MKEQFENHWRELSDKPVLSTNFLVYCHALNSIFFLCIRLPKNNSTPMSFMDPRCIMYHETMTNLADDLMVWHRWNRPSFPTRVRLEPGARMCARVPTILEARSSGGGIRHNVTVLRVVWPIPSLSGLEKIITMKNGVDDVKMWAFAHKKRLHFHY